MGKWAVIYSSVTGNTKKVAEAIAAQVEEADVFRVQEAPTDLSAYEVVCIGYWLRLGGPDPLTLKYLPQVHGAQVCFFQTHGTDPHSKHAITSFARAAYALGDGCEILGTFGCRGAINEALKEKRKNAGPDDPHGGAKSLKRWAEAAGHPNAGDLQAARDFAAAMQHKLVVRRQYRAKKAAKLAALKQKTK